MNKLYNVSLDKFITLPTSAACNDYQSQVNQTIRANDLAKVMARLNANSCQIGQYGFFTQ